MPRALTDLERTRASATKVTRAPAKIVRVSIKLNQPTKCIISLPRKLLWQYAGGGHFEFLTNYLIFFLHFQLKSLFNVLCEPILSTETNEFVNKMHFSEGPKMRAPG